MDKELRVSSRHKRNYLLRSLYIIILLFFVGVTWVNVFKNNISLTFYISRLAEAGKRITATIIWFQFIATQLIAVIIFCNSINDEIYHRTLGVLLTTPVTSLQIVMGKLLSKLYQIILLILISLPLLAIIRIFGGVSWNYILISLIVTLVAVIFAGSLSLFFSIIFRRSYLVIIITFSVLFLGYMIAQKIYNEIFDNTIIFKNLAFGEISPFIVINRIVNEMLYPGRYTPSKGWIFYCVFALFLSSLILLKSSNLIRKTALAYAFGKKSIWKRFLRNFDLFCEELFAYKHNNDDKIRHVWGPAIAWKEMVMKFSSREKMLVILIIAIELIMIIAMYLFPYIASGYGYEEAHILYIFVFMGIAAVSTGFFAVRSISYEKEAQTWSSLLMTPLSDWQIISGKLVGLLRKILPIWIMLLIYFIPFMSIADQGIMPLLFLISLIIGIFIFLYGAGLYFSSRCKNTNSAIIAFLILISSLWFIFPFFSNFDSPGKYLSSNYFRVIDYIEPAILANPFILAHTLVTTNLRSTHYIEWPDYDRGYFASFVLMTIVVMSYIISGILFAWRAKCLFRKNI